MQPVSAMSFRLCISPHGFETRTESFLWACRYLFLPKTFRLRRKFSIPFAVPNYSARVDPICLQNFVNLWSDVRRNCVFRLLFVMSSVYFSGYVIADLVRDILLFNLVVTVTLSRVTVSEIAGQIFIPRKANIREFTTRRVSWPSSLDVKVLMRRLRIMAFACISFSPLCQ